MQVTPTFRHLTITDGLSQNAVSSILQDRRGFMWFGTKDGLNRYDGYNFLIYRHDLSDPTSISDSDITALFEDDDGRLWVGTRNGGLNRFDRDLENFHRHDSGLDAPVSAIAQDGAGDLWIGTDGPGLLRLQPPARPLRRDRKTGIGWRLRTSGTLDGHRHPSLYLDAIESTVWAR